jgi:hypothetical protein
MRWPNVHDLREGPLVARRTISAGVIDWRD